jgi:GT2 family glycosyltransferase
MSYVDQTAEPPTDHIDVDNASSGDSRTQDAGPLRDVVVVRLGANAGFVRANNIAAAPASTMRSRC